jgi:3',5'-nucleoside bisphosphate phosphatase
MYADLHIHTCFSDGTDSPTDVLGLSKKNGLSVVAITDHDTVDGVKDAAEADHLGVALIPAIEISTMYSRRFMHILGYYVDIHNSSLAQYIREASADKTENTQINFERAVSQGAFDYSWERVVASNPSQIRLSGVHVANSMERDGVLCNGLTYREMFWEYFRPEGAEFIATEKFTPQDALNIIKTAGGVSVIAHPKLVENDDAVLELIRCGVEGIEVYYPLHSAGETQKYLRMAQEHGLLVTGGSDWHGKNSAPEVTHMGVTGLDNGAYGIFHVR